MFKTYFYSGLALIVLLLVGVFAYRAYQTLEAVPSDSPQGEYTFQVAKGETLANVAQKLERNNVVNSAQGLLIQERINPISPLQQGDYKLALPASPVQILKQIDTETIFKVAEIEKANKLPSVNVTLKEGWDLDKMFAELEAKGIASASDLAQYAKNPDNFDRQKYDFLPPVLNCEYGDLSNCVKYYVEGYLYPDTYSFFQPSQPKEVFEKMLTNFNRKVWSVVKSDVRGQDFQKVVTLASVIERETGRTRGITEQNKAEVSDERKKVASVFLNRTRSDIKWQSNPTVEYGQTYILCEQTFTRPGCKYLDDPVFRTKFNTYAVVGYPIGPISNPQLDNVMAALNPAETDFLYFVADATGKTYFGRNEAEHQQVIRSVNQINESLGVN